MRIGRKRVVSLLASAQGAGRLDRANRYVYLARKIGMRLQLRLARSMKRRFCKHCYTFLIPGVNMRVRVRRGKVVIRCAACKKFTRIPFRPRSRA